MVGQIKKNTDKFTGIYRGLVVDVADTEQYGRIRVKVYPTFADLETENIPWAVPAFGLFDGAGSNFGAFAIPKVGSYVFVFFEAGDVYQPVYFAEAPTAVRGLPDSRTTNYPDRKVWRTKNGIEIIIDDTEDDQIIKVIHSSGTYIEVDKDGNITLNPNQTHRSIVNAFSRTVATYDANATLTGDDGGLVLVDGAITLTLPDAAGYEGMEFVFIRIDTGTSPATIVGTIGSYSSRELMGQWRPFSIISDGTRWQEHVDRVAAGVIVEWAGTLANIPKGWLLCDGTQGTPDLRGRYVKGSAAGVDPGGTGGALTHYHLPGTYKGPTHRHSVPLQSYGFAYASGYDGYIAAARYAASWEGAGRITSIPYTTYDGNWAITGQSQTVNHEPPYYEVAYIKRM